MRAWGFSARRALAAAAGLLSALALAGCILTGGDSFFLGGGGGGEDFPNTAKPLSKELAKEAASSTGWGQAASLQLPQLPDLGVFGSLRIEPIDLSKALGKRALAKRAAEGECDTAYYDYSREEIAAAKRGRKIVCEEDDARTRRDTLVFWIRTIPEAILTRNDTAALIRYIEDSAVLIEARGAIAFKAEPKRQTYHAWNDDSLGTLDYADYVTTTTEASAKSVQRARLYGRDGAYQGENAPPAWYELLRTAGSDTLEWQRMADADGDSAFWDRTAKENAKGLVNFTRIAKNPGEDPAAARLTQTMRAQLHRVAGKKDSLATRWYFDRRVLKSGAVAGFSFRGVKPDSSLAANDTALVTLDTVYAASDSMASYRGDYRLLLGADPSDAAARSLTGLEVDKTWRRGRLKASNTRFFPAAALPPGQPFVGQISGQTRTKDGDTVYTDGTVDAQGMVLTLRVVSDGELTLYRLVLDLKGNEKEPMKEIPVNAKDETSTRGDTNRVVP